MSRYSKVKLVDPVPWRTNELNILLRAVKNDATIQSLCKVHRRSPESIKAKLNFIASDFYFTNPELFKQIQAITGITEREFLVKRELVPVISPIDTGSPKICNDDTIVNHDLVIPVKESNEVIREKNDDEDAKIGICIDLALSVLDAIVESTIVIKNTIQTLNSAGQRG
jgi:hypothetical protein